MKHKIEVTAIRYRMDGNSCATLCPFTDPKKRGLGIHVGSASCEVCAFHIADDREYKVVVCSNPGEAVFCKKDRALNKD